METAVIRQQLVEYLKVGDEKKIKAIYSLVEDEINTEAIDWDEPFIKTEKQK